MDGIIEKAFPNNVLEMPWSFRLIQKPCNGVGGIWFKLKDGNSGLARDCCNEHIFPDCQDLYMNSRFCNYILWEVKKDDSLQISNNATNFAWIAHMRKDPSTLVLTLEYIDMFHNEIIFSSVYLYFEMLKNFHELGSLFIFFFFGFSTQ